MEPWTCMHGRGPELSGLQPVHKTGDRLNGQVDCHHAFGLGVRFGENDFGHVNITAMAATGSITPDDFPGVGTSVAVRVLGYGGAHRQLRLSMEH